MVLKTLQSMGAIARLWRSTADRTSHGEHGPSQPGNHLSNSASPGTASVGQGRMGYLGDWTSGQVLLAAPQREKADRAGDRGLGAHRCHHGALPFPVELGGDYELDPHSPHPLRSTLPPKEAR